MVSGCWRPAALSEPERLYSVNDELQPVRLAYQDNDLWARYLASGDRTGFRNEIITAVQIAGTIITKATQVLAESQRTGRRRS